MGYLPSLATELEVIQSDSSRKGREQCSNTVEIQSNGGRDFESTPTGNYLG